MTRQPITGDYADRAKLFLHLLAVTGHKLSPESKVLDFGCGRGEIVDALRRLEVDAYGCDFADALDANRDRLAAIEEPYRLPFSARQFDCVLSDQVFEHVQDYGAALREIARVLRPGGTSLHMFPPRYSWRELHTFVPLATCIQSRCWLALWAALGVRNHFQDGKGAREVALLNHTYLREHTTYYPRREVLRHAGAVFAECGFLDVELLSTRPSAKGKLASTFARRLPILATLWSETHGRALLLRSARTP